MLAQAERDASEILAGRKSRDATGKLFDIEQPKLTLEPEAVRDYQKGIGEAVGPMTLESLIRDAGAKFSAREITRYVNLQRIAMHAEEQAAAVGDEDVSDEPLDDDWLSRWRENAQDVSSEHMQKVWARILTEEAKTPGTYSMRTLEFLRNLSKNDALKIAAIGPFLLNREWIYRADEIFKRRQITFSFLLELQEIGILGGVDSLGLSLTLETVSSSNYLTALTCHERALLISRATLEPKLTIPIAKVTKLGREVLALGTYTADKEYLMDIAAQAKSKGFSVKYGNWILKTPNEGQIVNPVDV